MNAKMRMTRVIAFYLMASLLIYGVRYFSLSFEQNDLNAKHVQLEEKLLSRLNESTSSSADVTLKKLCIEGTRSDLAFLEFNQKVQKIFEPQSPIGRIFDFLVQFLPGTAYFSQIYSPFEECQKYLWTPANGNVTSTLQMWWTRKFCIRS